jgi:hypothetical protein
MPDSTDELVVRVDYSNADLSGSVFDSMFRKRGLWVGLILSLILLVLLVANQMWAWMFAPLAFLGLVFSGYRRQVVLMKRVYGARGQTTFAFSNAGIAIKHERGGTTMDWTLLRGAHESRAAIFVSVDPVGFYFVPKRLLSVDQMERLREILRANIKRNILLMDGRDLAKV